MRNLEMRDSEDAEQWLVRYVSRQTGIVESDIDKGISLTCYGLTSADAALLCCELEQATGCSLPATLVWDYPDIKSLAEFLSTVHGEK